MFPIRIRGAFLRLASRILLVPVVAGIWVFEPVEVPDAPTVPAGACLAHVDKSASPEIVHLGDDVAVQLLCRADELIGVLADHPIDLPVPQFALDDARGVVDLLEELYLGHKGEDWE